MKYIKILTDFEKSSGVKTVWCDSYFIMLTNTRMDHFNHQEEALENEKDEINDPDLIGGYIYHTNLL